MTPSTRALAILPAIALIGCGGDAPVAPRDGPRFPELADVSPGALTPLPAIRPGALYQGQTGGLYGNSSNTPPTDHDERGRASAALVQPHNGKIVVLCLGFSNVARECTKFQTTEAGVTLARGEKRYAIEVGRGIVVVNGAQGNATAEEWEEAAAPTYDVVRDLRLPPYTEADVQVVWMELATKDVQSEREPKLPDPAANAWLIRDLCSGIMGALRVRYPNLRQVFLSQKIHGFYSTATPEPYAYETGFGTRACILEQTGELFVGWGPYLWDPSWGPEYFADDIGHPSELALAAVASLLHDFYNTSPYTGWWRGNPDPPPGPDPGPAISLSVAVRQANSRYIAELRWTGAEGSQVDVLVNGVKKLSTANDGSYNSGLGRRIPTRRTFRICETGGGRCSDEVSI